MNPPSLLCDLEHTWSEARSLVSRIAAKDQPISPAYELSRVVLDASSEYIRVHTSNTLMTVGQRSFAYHHYRPRGPPRLKHWIKNCTLSQLTGLARIPPHYSLLLAPGDQHRFFDQVKLLQSLRHRPYKHWFSYFTS